MVDKVVARGELPKTLGQIMSMLMGGKRQAA
jgi:acetyl-CoA carboxylase carboxyl transferase subunit beta